jgi:hypothetical protein
MAKKANNYGHFRKAPSPTHEITPRPDEGDSYGVPLRIEEP